MNTMQARSVLSEIWRDIISGMARSVSLTICIFVIVTSCAGVDALQVISIERQANEFEDAKGDVSLVKSSNGIDGQTCNALSQGSRMQASGALRQNGDMTLSALPHNAITRYEVTDGFLNVIDGTIHDHQGVWLPSTLAKKLGVSGASSLQTSQGKVRVAGVYDWPEDGRDSRLGYAVLVPVPAADAFDECWASAWPATDVSTEMRQSVYATSDPSQAQTGSLNYANGETMDAYGLFASRLTRFAMPAGCLVTFALAFVYLRRRRLEIAGDLHAGASKPIILLQMLGEHMIPTLMGMIMAYSVLFILVRLINPTPADTMPIFLLELHEGLLLPCATAAGILISTALIKENDLFKLFKTR